MITFIINKSLENIIMHKRTLANVHNVTHIKSICYINKYKYNYNINAFKSNL